MLIIHAVLYAVTVIPDRQNTGVDITFYVLSCYTLFSNGESKMAA